MEYIKQKKIYSFHPFPMQLHRTEYELNFSTL